MGTLYYGDNPDILRRYLKDETVDLVYLDPPFNSAQNYNAFFHEKDGTGAANRDCRQRKAGSSGSCLPKAVPACEQDSEFSVAPVLRPPAR